MMARKPGSRSKPLAPAIAAGALLGRSSGRSPRLASAPSPATPAITQIRRRAAIRSTSSPQASAPAMKAAEPHSRSGP
jgi:hypothetical protein